MEEEPKGVALLAGLGLPRVPEREAAGGGCTRAVRLSSGIVVSENWRLDNRPWSASL